MLNTIPKKKICISSLGACGGCDEAIVDLNEELLKVAAEADIVFWPTALDYKYHHLRDIKDGEIGLSIVSGHVRNSEQEEIARLIRQKSQIVLAFGACSCFGGTPGLANFGSKEDILEWVYKMAPTVVNPKGTLPELKTQLEGKELTLPEFFDRVYALRQVIAVDYYLPGCPPPVDLIINAVNAVLTNKMPSRGATLGPHRALCDSCKRNSGKPLSISIKEIRRIHQFEARPDQCFLAQGVLCLGPATRDGCGEPCINANVPCRGCCGPVEGVEDSGVKYISALASMLNLDNDGDIDKFTANLGDLAGYLYRFSLPVAALGKIQD
jgi:F420-non-reducing hydrogenase small subunit